MYWSKQEQFIFDVILFVLVIFQISTFFMLKTEETNLRNVIILVGLNFLLFVAMIPYARWVWKLASYRQGFLRLVKHEMLLLGLFAAAIFLPIASNCARLSGFTCTVNVSR